MSAEAPNHKVQIIVAVIGLLGALGGALFANWDKLFPRVEIARQVDDPNEPAPTVKETPAKGGDIEPSKSAPGKFADTSRDAHVNANAPARPSLMEVPEESVRNSVKVRASRSSTVVDVFNGKERHEYFIWIEAQPHIMNAISKVKYNWGHPEWFELPVTESSDRNSGFRSGYLGIGAVNAEMDVVLILYQGGDVVLKFDMHKEIFGK